MFAVLRSLFITALICALSSSTPLHAQTVEPSILLGSSGLFPKIDVKAIRKVRCTGGHGTGFVIGQGRLMTAYHVIDNHGTCYDDETGRVLQPVYWDKALDIAILTFTPGRHEPRPLHVNCAAYKTESTYYSYGFAGLGYSDLMITRMRAIDSYTDGPEWMFQHMRGLRGVVIPGMSGGPIFDDRGNVVGINNMTAGEYHFGMSREIRDTYLCKK